MMNKKNELVLSIFWVFSIVGIAGISLGIANIVSIGAGFLVGGLVSFIMIPFGIEYIKRYIKID
jgi:uncharacterized membrane protein